MNETLVKDQSAIDEVLSKLKLNGTNYGTAIGSDFFSSEETEILDSTSPVDGSSIAKVATTCEKDYHKVIDSAAKAYEDWKKVPAPKRGEVIRQFGNKLRDAKQELGTLVSFEMGKSLQEGLGEVQEMIDICDFAVGLSRQLYGSTMHSERPEHRMYDQYHPLGVVGVISAFNFPTAVWAWNAALALIAGDTIVWKPSEKAPLCGVASQKILAEALEENGYSGAISGLVTGDYKIGELMTADKRIPLVSATGSIRMGRIVGQAVAKRFGKSLLELGGNNAIILTPNADLELSLKTAVFGAIGTAGQRCTSTRRLIIHESIYDSVLEKLKKIYSKIKIGNPLDESNHMGPLIDTLAVDTYLSAIEQAKQQGGKMLVEGSRLNEEGMQSGCYVSPSIAEVKNEYEIVQNETFAPLLYVMKYSTLTEAIELQNGVVQGLSSAIMTSDMREAELFLSQQGSDCGIANVNVGTSGAEIGGAFGGEKETGGGRESGSDAWKLYMRRQTNTINYGLGTPLAQGIKFDL
ncbi:MAG: aldehyde dehydrogenase family protein [Ichthyobacteriaceae bacterium]|nr:aldehyde dehydrogenase family protein [Ichthyobacteriaceae bacterium]